MVDGPDFATFADPRFVRALGISMEDSTVGN
jgi:hypothetical protein